MSTSHQPVLGPGFVLPRVAAAKRERQVRTGRSRVRTVAASTVVGLCVLAAVGLAAVLAVAPAVAGGHTLTVLSGSMSPAIQTGSVVVVVPVHIEDVAVGEIVTYATTDPVSGANTLVTHRVTGITTVGGEPMLTTKGDANDVADAGRVSAEQLRGRLWYQVPMVGTVRDAVFTKSGAMYAAAGGLLILGLVLLRGIGRSASAASSSASSGPRTSNSAKHRRAQG